MCWVHTKAPCSEQCLVCDMGTKDSWSMWRCWVLLRLCGLVLGHSLHSYRSPSEPVPFGLFDSWIWKINFVDNGRRAFRKEHRYKSTMGLKNEQPLMILSWWDDRSDQLSLHGEMDLGIWGLKSPHTLWVCLGPWKSNFLLISSPGSAILRAKPQQGGTGRVSVYLSFLPGPERQHCSIQPPPSFV